MLWLRHASCIANSPTSPLKSSLSNKTEVSMNGTEGDCMLITLNYKICIDPRLYTFTENLITWKGVGGAAGLVTCDKVL